MKIHINSIDEPRKQCSLFELGGMPVGTVAYYPPGEGRMVRRRFVTVAKGKVLELAESGITLHDAKESDQHKAFVVTSQEVEINVLYPGQTPTTEWTQACLTAMRGIADPIQFMRDLKSVTEKARETDTLRKLLAEMYDEFCKDQEATVGLLPRQKLQDKVKTALGR